RGPRPRARPPPAGPRPPGRRGPRAAGVVATGPFPVVFCDVFTDRPLAGNQLAVFPHGEAVPEELMQPIAREINFSETVFALPPAADGDTCIRIFTPASELPFAGHPVPGPPVLL